MTGSLFVVSGNISSIVPGSLDKAVNVATEILRSDEFQEIFVNIQTNHRTLHIDRTDLKTLLAGSALFTIDKIRVMDGLDYRAHNKSRDSSCISLNPLLLLEFMDREREFDEVVANPHLCLDMSSEVTSNGKVSAFNLLVYLESKPRNSDGPVVQSLKKQKINALPTTSSIAMELYNTKVDGMSLIERHILLLTIILVHEAVNLLSSTFYINILTSHEGKQDIQTQSNVMYSSIRNTLDIAYIVEKELFGHVIKHSVSDAFKSPFGIEFVIGTQRKNDSAGYILGLSPTWKDLINGTILPTIVSGALILPCIEEFSGRLLSCGRREIECILVSNADYTNDDVQYSSSSGGSGEENVVGGETFLPLSAFMRI